MTAVTIKVFLPHGDAKLLRTAEISNWTGKAIAAPRSQFDDLLNREELLKPGIYLLTESDPNSGDPFKKISKRNILICEIKGLKGEGMRTPDGFVVFKGSQAVAKERPSASNHPYIFGLRAKLLKDGSLGQEKDHLYFTRDVEFSSPSAAAAIIHGGTANGLIAWKDKSGKTLKQIENDLES